MGGVIIKEGIFKARIMVGVILNGGVRITRGVRIIGGAIAKREVTNNGRGENKRGVRIVGGASIREGAKRKRRSTRQDSTRYRTQQQKPSQVQTSSPEDR